MNNSNILFSEKLLNNIEKPLYVLSIDPNGSDFFSFCLGRKTSYGFEIILAKKVYEKKEFDTQVKILSELFDAKIIE